MTADPKPLEARLKDYIESAKNATLDLEPSELGGTHLINDLGMDSLDIINLLFQIEESEKVDISEAEMESHSLFEFDRLAAHIRERRDS